MRWYQLVGVGIPDQNVLYIQESNFETMTGEPSPEGFDPNYYYDVVGDFLSAQRILFLNLHQAYQEQDSDPISLYRECNVHGMRLDTA